MYTKQVYTYLLLLFAIISTVHGTVTIPGVILNFTTFAPMDFGFEANSTQLTPQGPDWPLFDTVTAPLSLNVDGSLTCDMIPDTIVLAIAGYLIDNDINFYRSCNATGVIFMSPSPGDPGGSITRMTTMTMTRDDVFPLVDIDMDMFEPLINIFLNTTAATQGQIMLLVTINATQDDNYYKVLAYSGQYIAFAVVYGLLTIGYIVPNVIIVVRLGKGLYKKYFDRTAITIPMITSCLLTWGGALKILSYLNYGGYFQYIEYGANNFLNYAGISGILSACFFIALMMFRLLDESSLKISLVVPLVLWPYILGTVVLFANDYILSALSATYRGTPSASLAIIFIWIVIAMVTVMAIAIVMIIAFIMVTIKRVKNANKYKYSKKGISRFVTYNFIISICLIVYVIITALAINYLYTSRFYLIFSYYGHDTMLIIIAVCITINNFSNLKRMEKKVKVSSKTSELATSSKQSQNEGPVSARGNHSRNSSNI